MTDAVTDVVVILPGLLGSTLSKNKRVLWAPSAGAALRAVRTLGGSLRELTLPEGLGDEAPIDGVEPVALMPDLHILPGLWTAHLGYDVLVDRLRSALGLVPVTADGPPGNLMVFPYDWRLSNRYNGKRLGREVEPVLERWRAQGGAYADARLVLIGHSMGGLVARWYVQREGGIGHTRAIITLGTPHRGALSALEQLVNGVRKGPWPFRIDLTAFARSLPSIHQLLPEYACIDSGGTLLRTTETEVPELARGMVADAMAFHAQLDDGWPAVAANVDLYPIVGQHQTTATTARLVEGKVVPMSTIEGVDEAGDATVPRLSATPLRLSPADPSVHYATERHGALQSNTAVLDELEGVLTARDVVRRAAPPECAIDVRVDDVLMVGEEVTVEVAVVKGSPRPLEVVLVDERGTVADRAPLGKADESWCAVLDPPPPGAYVVHVRGAGAAVGQVTEVTAPLLIWDEGGT